MSRPRSASIKFWYGFGQSAEGMMNTAFGAFLLLFFSQVLGLPAHLAGLALALALVADAVTDPLVGSLSDALESRWGRRHPFMYGAAVPMWITFALVFRPPEGMPSAGLFVWMLVSVVLARLAMTLYHVPHLALGAELANDYHERTTIVGYRQFFALAGGAALFLAAREYYLVPTSSFPNGELNPSAYPPMAMVFGLVMGISIFASALGTHSVIPTLQKPSGKESFSLARVARELREALKNPSFFWLFWGVVVFFVARGVKATLDVHMSTFFWRLETEQVLLVPLVGLVGLGFGTPFWAVKARSYDKHRLFMFCLGWYSLLTLLLPSLKIVGLFPPSESLFYVGLIYGFVFLASFGVAGSMIVVGSMMADVADEHELNVGRRQEGIFFGALSFSGKASVGAGSALAGLGLTFIQFPLQVPPAQVPPEMSIRLGILAGPAMAAVMLVGLLMMRRYDLSRERVTAVQGALAARHHAGCDE